MRLPGGRQALPGPRPGGTWVESAAFFSKV